MLNLLRAELYKLYKCRNFWHVCVAAAFVFGGAFYLDSIGWWGMENATFDFYHSVGLDGYAANLLLGTSLFYNLCLCALAAFFINADHAVGVVKNQIICGKSRSIIYMSKALVFALSCVVVAVVVPAIVSVCLTIAAGRIHIYTGQNIAFLVQSYGLFALVIVAYSSFLMLIASITKESGKTILFAVIISIVAYVINLSSAPLVEKMYSYTIFAQGYIAFTENTQPLQITVVSLLSFVIPLLWGCCRFKREEIK